MRPAGIRYGATLAIACLFSSRVLAGLPEGDAFSAAGDYPRAIAEFEPLAAAGDAKASIVSP